MATFNVTFEIDVEAENSLEASKTVRDWLRNPHTEWQFYVQNIRTKEVHSVDLSEEDEDAVLPANYEPQIK